MKIITKKLSESVLCMLPSGEHVEVTMLCVEGEDCFAEPNIEGALNIVLQYFDFALS